MRTIINISLAIIFLAVPFLSAAQGAVPDDVNDVPIDGGLSLLMAAGGSYVAKKMYDAKKRKSNKNKEK